jgi:hypothetical protein
MGKVEGLAYCAPQLCRGSCRGKALGIIFAALLLLNAAAPYWHAAQKLQAWTSAYAGPEARHESATTALS